MNMSLDVTIFGFSRSQFLMIELKHQKERKKCQRRVYSESHDLRKSSMRNTLITLQETVHKHTDAFLEQVC